MRESTQWLSVIAALFLFGCDNGDDDDTTADDDDSSAENHYPTTFCPGDPSGACDPSDDTTLYAGAAATTITPTCWETWNDVNGNDEYGVTEGDTFNDCGCDQLCPGDDGYTSADDGEADGTFQTAWLAGSSQGRALREIHDDLWIRAIVLAQGNTAIALVSADVVGFNRAPIKAIEAEVMTTTDVDYVVWSSTHQHQGPDTIGMWGPSLNTSGLDMAYVDFLKETAVAVIEQAATDRVPVDTTVAQYDIAPTDCEGSGVNNFNMDHRDPNIIDERVFSVLFTEAGTASTVATLVNWPNHPEVMIDETYLTSGFPHDLRLGLEEGVQTADGPVDGLGGTAVYFQGMCGGMMTPLGADPYDLMGNHWTDYDFDMVKAIGDYLAYFSLESLASGEALTDPELRFRFKEFQVPVENQGYWLFLNLGVLNTEMFTFEIPDPDETIGEYNMPLATTEVGVIELGPIEILTIPGEMLPELGIGGYDGSHTGPLQELIDESNNPLDITQAPAGPYLADLMDGEYNLFFGLANDELGYIIPPWQYELGEPAYLAEAEGDHYEETNSVGPQITPNLLETAEALLAWVFPE